jgi:hypothetical protein
MAILDYTLSSLNKNIVYEIPNRFYNSEEVVDLIKRILGCVDHSLMEEHNGKDKWKDAHTVKIGEINIQEYKQP